MRGGHGCCVMGVAMTMAMVVMNAASWGCVGNDAVSLQSDLL